MFEAIFGLVLGVGQLLVGYFLARSRREASAENRWLYITAHGLQILKANLANASGRAWQEIAVETARDILAWAASDPLVGTLGADDQARVAEYVRTTAPLLVRAAGKAGGS